MVRSLFCTSGSLLCGLFRTGFLLFLLSLAGTCLRAQDDTAHVKLPDFTTVMLRDSSMKVVIRNIDITRFPDISIVFDVTTFDNQPVNGLMMTDVQVAENGVNQKVIALRKIERMNRIPVDIVFAVDRTGSMGEEITGVKENIDMIATQLAERGIDVRVGMVVFDDKVGDVRPLTDDLSQFKRYLDAIKVGGGGDEPENALEALKTCTTMDFRPSANRVVVLVTDAPYHKAGELGFGRTELTSQIITNLLTKKELRTFCIVNPKVAGYQEIATATGGRMYDIRNNFSDILGDFVVNITSSYVVTYRTDTRRVPDSITVQVSLPRIKKVTTKRLAVLEVGRKLLLTTIRFGSNSATIAEANGDELATIVRLMQGRPTLKLRIEGHTDSVGTAESNERLSWARAESVKRYLVRAGVPASRLFTFGFGELRPTAPNDTDEGRQLNRRTEFVIIAK